MAIIDMDEMREADEHPVVWSSFQTDIFKEVETSKRPLIIEAVAGSGKSTTIIAALELIPSTESSIFVAFNKSIADDLANKVPFHVEARTLHSMGYEILRNNYTYAKSNSKKVNNIMRFEVLDTKNNRQHWEWCTENGYQVQRFISSIRMGGCQSVELHELEDWIDQGDYDIPTDRWSLQVIQQVVQACWKFDGEKGNCTIDFDDMIALPAYWDMKFPTYDNVFVDESQDLNKAQRMFIGKLLGSTGRLIAVGDTHQAIYGFRGADHNSMSHIRGAFGCKELPLSICYRCDKAIVEKAKYFVPHIEAREGAGEGEVRYVDHGKHWDFYQSDDYILCRTNAPLVAEAMRLSIRGHNVCIMGRDLVRPLMKNVKVMCGIYNGSIDQRDIREWTEDQVAGLSERKQYKAYNMWDQAGVLCAICGSTPMGEAAFKKTLEDIFTDKRPVVPHILLSTIHKSKGLEADRVFILRPDLMPHPMAKGIDELKQEDNLHYVAITRAKHMLTYLVDMG